MFDRPDAVLRRHFGHEAFRPGQGEVVDTVLSGRDVIVVMPTGGGKSLTYQLPALVSREPTLVVSPLIALMKDQVDQLEARGIAAAALHSQIDSSRQRAIEAEYRGGRLRLLYVAPERLMRSDLRALLVAQPPARIVVDEAHCISEWGHDFRRDYLRIGEVAADLAPIQLVACTATATPEVRADITTRLGMRDPAVVVRGFARPELHLAVERLRSEEAKLERLLDVLDPDTGHAIVYAGTKRRAIEVAERIARRMPCMLYHADLGASERVAAQERFARGEVRVAVATSAFGMGVDVATVRQVVHVGLPQSLEEYYQQAGRAGRDGLPARCTLLHTPADRRLPEFFIDAAHPDAERLGAVWRSLQASGRDPGAWRFVVDRDPAVDRLSDAEGDGARRILADAGLIGPDGELAAADSRRLPLDHARIAGHRRLAYRRFGSLTNYLGAARCRHRVIVEHFGDRLEGERCGDRCDVCAPGARARPVTVAARDDVRRALSGVARMNGRFGLAKVAAVLAGSRARAVTDTPGLAALPTHGALGAWREPDIAELLRSLVDVGAVRQAGSPYPVVSLTEHGVAAMRGEIDLDVADPRGGRRGAAVTPTVDEALDATGEAALRALREWRTRVARAHSWPAYMVFSDRTLAAIAAARPLDEAALATIPGVGPMKLERWGAEVLGVLGAAAADGSPELSVAEA